MSTIMAVENILNVEDIAVNLLDLPREVLCQALSLLSRPRDIISSGLTCRALLICVRDAPVTLELSTPVAALRDPEQSTAALLANLEKYTPGVCHLSLSNVPLDDQEVLAVLSRLPHLTQLDLSGCRKLSPQIGGVFSQLPAASAATGTPARPAPAAAAPALGASRLTTSSSTCPPAAGSCQLPQRPATRLQSLSVQRCFQLNAGSLTQLLAAASAGGGAPQLCSLFMSHLDLAGWPATLMDPAAAAVRGSSDASSATSTADVAGSADVGMSSAADAAVAGGSSASAGAGERAAGRDTTSVSITHDAERGSPFQGTGTASDGLQDLPAAPPLAARLCILALHNCSKLTPGGAWILARACPALRYLLLGGSSLSFYDGASTPAALRDTAPEFVPADLRERVATSPAVEALSPAAQAHILDTVAHLVALVAALPHLTVLELSMMSPHIVQGVRSMLEAPGWQDHLGSHGGGDRQAPAVWDFASRETLAAVLAQLCAAERGRPPPAAAGRASAAPPPPASALRLAVKCAVGCSSATRSTPLHRAAERDDGASVRALLALGAAPDARDTRGATALFLAAEAGRAVAADALLSGGADCTLSNTAGESPLYISALRGHLAVVRRLVEHCQATGMAWCEASLYGDKWTPLMAAAVADRHDIAALLLQAAGPSAAPLFVKSTNRYGQSVMHIAARKGSPALLQLLLAAGGAQTVAHADTVGDTPVDVAKKHRHVVALAEFSKAWAVLKG